MAWIKRNLLFVIGSFIALVLIGVGVWFLVSAISDETAISDRRKAQYSEAGRLNQLKPHPGNDAIDNIKIAREQQAALKAYLAKAAPLFQRIPGIPDDYGSSNKVSNSGFAAELRNTISDLRKSATNKSVILPQDYYFSFESQRKILIFDPSGLEKLASQLGEIKSLCEILFDAKINSLDSIRREASSTNDNNPSDYLSQKTVVTPLADFSPYELTFRCFSSELAEVMGHIASSPNGLIIKSINVEPANGASMGDESGGNENMGGNPGQMPPPGAMRMPGVLRGPPGSFPPGGYSGPVPAVVAPNSKGPQAFISEKPLRITMIVDVVKLKPAAK